MNSLFVVGDQVEKVHGYKYPGWIVAVFFTRNMDIRYVVECSVPGCEGMLHIFNANQLRKIE